MFHCSYHWCREENFRKFICSFCIWQELFQEILIPSNFSPPMQDNVWVLYKVQKKATKKQNAWLVYKAHPRNIKQE